MADAKTAINTWTGRAPIVMSVLAIALLVVAFTTGWERGYKDEGAVAHSWQLLVGLQVPLIAAFLVTSNWRQPLRIALMLGLQILGLAIAMAPVAILRL